MSFYNKNDIENIIPGYWYREPQHGWYAESVTISRGQVKLDKNKKVLFLAIDSKTWHKGSQNKNIYAGWEDTHHTVKNFQKQVGGVIAQKPLPELDEHIPQYITSDTYETMKLLADHAFKNFNGQMIAITGTAGKSTVKNLLEMLLGKNSKVVATRGNHNTRTGVPLTVACAVTQPDFLIVESAVSSLWTKPHGVMKNYPPSIAMITSIDGGQKKNAHETAVLKAKVAEGMNHNGTVVLNQDMKEYDTVYEAVNKYNKKVLTYGFNEEADSRVLDYKELREGTVVDASILGEKVRFSTKLNGAGMIQNIIGVLTVIKTMEVSLDTVLDFIPDYIPGKGVLNFEEHQKSDGTSFTILDDGWNATGIATIEAINLISKKAQYFKGKNIAIIGRIENLGPEESVRQHEALVQPILDSEIDIVFAHGPEMKHTLKLLPEDLIGGYFENSGEMAQHVSNVIGQDDLILIKGSPRSSDFKFVKSDLLNFAKKKKDEKEYSHHHPYSTSAGAATFDISNDEKVSFSGDQQVMQNQGLGGVLLINLILEEVFSKKFKLQDKYLPGTQELNENKAPKALKLMKKQEVSLAELISAAVTVHSPNALLMMANQVMESNRQTLLKLKESANALELNEKSVSNITGRRISSKQQRITIGDLYVVGKELFDKFPFILDLVSQKSFVHNQREYKINSNLYSYGAITHGLFFGHLDSLGIVLSQIKGEKYITVVAGASDAFHRDQLVLDSLRNIEGENVLQDVHEPEEKISDEKKDKYSINIIGDTYFGEFYSDIRKKNNRSDVLLSKERAYSFDEIRSFLSTGDLNICNFEAAVSDSKVHKMKKRKPFVLYSDPINTVKAIKVEKIHLVTLANNHLMDCGMEGLKRTLNEFKDENIYTMGAGANQQDAERPYVKVVNNQRIAIFNAYWYRNPMHREFDFYALADQPGVACLSGHIQERIKSEKEENPDGKIIVIAHWGADFQTVNTKQKEYAHSLVSAGADLIIGHGVHMIQEIEKIGSSIVAYSIGNGVFNSDGEYNRRFVAPYSMAAQIQISEEEVELRLYPIYSNNLKTFWQPRSLEEKEMVHCTLMLKSFGSTKLDINKENEKYFYSFLISH